MITLKLRHMVDQLVEAAEERPPRSRSREAYRDAAAYLCDALAHEHREDSNKATGRPSPGAFIVLTGGRA